jgi:hypothetical protein
VEVVVNDLAGKTRFARRLPVQIAAGERGEVRCEWTPPADAKDVFPATVSTRLLAAGSATPAREVPLDSISHRIELLPDEPASPQEFVSVSGSHFRLGGKPWYMRGVNYRPDNQGGLPPLDMLQRDRYDPEIIERDLEWMQSAGINMLSAIHASQPLDPDAPAAYRDTQDFLNRCRRHGMKVFYFLPWGNPLNKPDVAAIKKHIAAAGLKEHPAILAWELAWEPIHVPGAARHGMPDLVPDWNAWIVERYGSLAEAEHDWGFSLKRLAEAPPKPARSKAGLAVPMRKARPPAPRVGPPAGRVELADLPEARWCASHGPWDRAVAAFRRFFSDHIGRGYGDIIRELSDFDPQHLVTFRFGACGIPDKVRFADAHSAAVAKHVSFLCPEGYNLQPGGPAQLSPADDIRQGGLVTLYYRFLSREKPVVWMEFGYSVNGMNTSWKPGLEHIRPSELDHQRTEFAHFYQMFLESGARGAAPWWLPGGFRLGENSDFGILEPDGSPRPACQVLRESLPKFAAVGDASCVAGGEAQSHTATQVITLDLDAHYADAWDFYAPQYLAAVKAGRRPLLRTAGTGSTSADCPLLAVGDTPCTGRNPPAHLNAEFDQVEVQESPSAAWRYVGRDQVITVGRGAKVRCRARIGNTAEATWLAPRPDGPETGAVYLGCQSQGAATQLRVPITESTPYLGDADTAEFELPLPGPGQERVTLQMRTARASAGHVLPIPFGEKWSFTIKVLP